MYGGWKRESEDGLKKVFSHTKLPYQIIKENMELIQPQNELKQDRKSKFTVENSLKGELNQRSIWSAPTQRKKNNCSTDRSKSELGRNTYKTYSHECSKGESNYLGKNAIVFLVEVMQSHKQE